MSETDGVSGGGGDSSAGGGSDNDVSAETEASVDAAMSEDSDSSAGTGDTTGGTSDDGTVDDMTEDDAVATQERMEAESKAAKESFDRQQSAQSAADQTYADAMDQEVAAQNAAAEAQAEEEAAEETEDDVEEVETAVPGTYADTHVAQGLSGVNEGIANVLGGPVDLVEMGLNGLMSAAEYVGVPESWTPEFEGSFLGSDHIKDMMTETGSILPESADPAKQTTRDVAEVTTEVVSAVVGAGALTQGRTLAQQADDVLETGLTRTPDPVDLDLRYKDGWSEAQRIAADAKAQALTEADTVVTRVERSGTSAASRYAREVGPVPQGMDVDHIQELQLGGLDEVINMAPLDRSVNRSFGAQIQHQIKDLEVGTPVNNVTIRDR